MRSSATPTSARSSTPARSMPRASRASLGSRASARRGGRRARGFRGNQFRLRRRCRVGFRSRGGPAGGFDPSDIFSELFGAGGPRAAGGGARRPRNGADVKSEATVTLQEAVRGATLRLSNAERPRSRGYRSRRHHRRQGHSPEGAGPAEHGRRCGRRPAADRAGAPRQAVQRGRQGSAAAPADQPRRGRPRRKGARAHHRGRGRDDGPRSLLERPHVPPARQGPSRRRRPATCW